jgi:hypothetical protein
MPRPDRRVSHIGHGLTGCSMVLSGYFGWSLGEGVFPLNIVLGILCAGVAFAVPVMFEKAAYFDHYSVKKDAAIWWFAGSLFLAFNTIADYGAAAALRDAVSVAATNQNNKVDDVRGQIKLVEKNISDAKATVAWQSSLLPAPSYEAEISNLEGNMTIMERSKNCSDQTRPDTKAHCQKLAAARANLGMANQKAAYEIQVSKWEDELKSLKDKSEKTELHTNPAIAQVRAIASWAKMDRNLTEDNVAWGSLAVMLVMTILVNMGLALCGHAVGKQKAIAEIAFAEAEADEPRPVQRLAYHPRGDDRPAIEPEPIPLRPAPTASRNSRETSETVIVTTSTANGGALPMTGDPNVDEVLRRSQQANEAARKKIADMLAAMKAAGSA